MALKVSVGGKTKKIKICQVCQLNASRALSLIHERNKDCVFRVQPESNLG